MHLRLPDREVRFFTVLRRVEDGQMYHFKDMEKLISLSEEFRYSGVLLFQNNKAFIEPWFFSQVLLNQSKTLSPFIALNPVYMHPFSAARLLISISLFHDRKFYVNFISGASRSELEALGDYLDHANRYKRLHEFLYIFNALIKEELPVTFSGKFYNVKNLRLSGKLPKHLWPCYFLAGSSPEALSLISKFDVSHLEMAKKSDSQTVLLKEPSRKAIHFGIITAATGEMAEEELSKTFGDGESQSEKDLMDYAMKNTDAFWKNMLYHENQSDDKASVFRIAPFKKSKSDCPYLVGSYDTVATYIEQYICAGITDFVIEINETIQSFQETSNMLHLLEQRMKKHYTVPEHISGTVF
jgi:alkanesulfonate monooxygenase